MTVFEYRKTSGASKSTIQIETEGPNKGSTVSIAVPLHLTEELVAREKVQKFRETIN